MKKTIRQIAIPCLLFTIIMIINTIYPQYSHWWIYLAFLVGVWKHIF